MIKYEKIENGISIKGLNKIDFAIISWGIFILGLIGLCSIFRIENGIIEEVIYMVVIILVLFFFRISIRFKIIITKNCVEIKKTFLVIPYLSIEWNFEKVQIPNTSTIQFQNGNQKLEIENFEGFEVDCLLIVKGNSQYEIGNKEDAQNIFNYILNAIKDF